MVTLQHYMLSLQKLIVFRNGSSKQKIEKKMVGIQMHKVMEILD
jgi:hypothetical protein